MKSHMSMSGHEINLLVRSFFQAKYLRSDQNIQYRWIRAWAIRALSGLGGLVGHAW
jgi:hypothetical protein